MRLAFVILLVLAVVSSTIARAKVAPESDKEALIQACKELGGGTKIRLEFDLGAACNGPCGKKKKKKVNAPA